MPPSNFIDKFVGYISPRAGLERARARTALDYVTSARNYEGASSGRRTDGWYTTSGSANASNANSFVRLRNRSRDLVRNNPYAAKAVSVIANNVVGTGVVPRATSGRGKRATNAMDLWKTWAETTECDADGQHDIYGLQMLAMRTTVESGECLIRRRWRRHEDGLSVPVQLQILEPDFIDTSKDMLQPDENGMRIIQGIQFDALGRRVGYIIFNSHPGDNHLFQRLESKIVPAEEIIHLYRVDRPGQVRGVPWASPVVLRLRDFDDYEDAQLLRQKLAACFTAFVTDTDAGAVGPAGAQRSIAETLEPGAIELMPPGKSIEFANPPGVAGYAEYATTTLRGIAAGFGITYEAMTGDLSNVNFSSGRMGWLEFHRNVEAWRWGMFIPRMCDGVWKWFSQAAAINGARMEGVAVEWTPPRREMIDPVQETNAAIRSIRGGLTTLPEALRQLGQDPETVLTEYADTAKRLDELGLVLECDPRRTTQSGQIQIEPTNGTNNNDNGSNA